ncbi:MAG: PKD domain-containing protein [Saprospiraceae bacterium]
MVVKLFSNPNGIGPFQYEWDLGDNRTSSLANPRIIYQNRNPQTIQLTTTDQNGCSSSQTRQVNMHPGTNECSILLTPPAICNDSSGNISYCVKAIAIGGEAPYQITYDNNTYNTNILNIPLTDFPVNDLCVSVEDATGISASTCGNFNLSTSSPSGAQSCNTQFTYQSDLEEIPFDSLQLGTVEVIYTDDNGEVFSSANVNGSTLNQFNLTELIPYQRNNAGQKTSIAKISFSCMLKSDSGTEILMENVIGSFGFAHPD